MCHESLPQVLFRDVQLNDDGLSVKDVLVERLQNKLATFRALSQEQRDQMFSPEGILNDNNAAMKEQNETQTQQASGQGAGVGCEQVFSKPAGIASVIGIIAVMVGIILPLVLKKNSYWAIAGVGYFIYLCASCCSTEAGYV